jgi:hypothetical protein
MKNPYTICKTIACLSLAGALINLVPASAFAGEWEFTLTPYIWMAGLEGRVDAFATLPPADVDASFKDDILGNINMAFMLVAETRKDRFGVLMDLAYVDIEESASLRDDAYLSASLQAKLWLYSLLGEYRILDSDRGFLDLLGGMKYTSVKNIIDVSTAESSRSVSAKDDWFDLVVGIRGVRALGDSPWFVSGAVLAGGFGLASDSLWDLNLNLGYQWTESFSTTLGYRYFDVDYEDDGFLADLTLDGAVIGFRWNW